MQSKTLFKIKTGIQKFALLSKEDIDLENFTDHKPKDIAVIKDPYPYIIVDDFFKPEVYQGLCEEFNKIKNKGFSESRKRNPNQFYRFDMDYDGYVFVPPPTLDKNNPLSFFFSLQWNRFMSHVFKQFTTFETRFAFHHHPVGDRTGFVHNDDVDMSFSSRMMLQNGVIYEEENPSDIKRRRILSILLYLNNDDWKEGDGGGTGIYAKDKKTLLKVVNPKNNRLFVFQTGPDSNHAFQTNKTPRSSLIQWFHVPPEML